MARRILLGACFVIALFLALEAFVQISGIIDFPLYDANAEIGYIPRPDQHGSFLHRRDFEFNEFSMGAGHFAPSAQAFDLLLVGDSIVLGGNPYSQPDRLGPQLAKLSSWNVWPISAGSWALQNELTYLREHAAQVSAVDAVAFILNSGDFDEPSSWRNELTHPRHRPFPGLIYVFRKFVHPIFPIPPTPAELMVKLRPWQRDLADFARSTEHPIYVFLYPDRNELNDVRLRQLRLDSRLPNLKLALGNHGQVFELAKCKDWNVGWYGDEIHPTVKGTRELAKIIKNSLDGSPCEQ